MSNLIKSVYFNVQQEDKHVIDSESKMKVFVPELQENTRTDEDNAQDVSFVEGMNVLNLEQIVEDEAEKQLKEAKDEILNEAREVANQIIREAEEASEMIRTSAYEEGKKEGYDAGCIEAEVLFQQKKEELEAMRLKLQENYQKQQEELEPAFVKILIALVQKVTGVLVENHKGILLYLIDRALKGLEKPERVTVRVSKADMVKVMSVKQRLRDAVSEGVEFDIVEEKTLTQNQCIIETEDKVIDCSLDVQLDGLVEQLKLLTYM